MNGFRTRGHPIALAAVRRAVRTGRPPHAMLIVGPDGVGKTTLALDLAAGLLCVDPDPASRPCRDCAACRKVEHDNHPDLHRLMPEGAGDQIRLVQVHALVAELALLPMEGRWRVAIIEAAHRLNPDAQNALLKTLEEPVGAACIVLVADEPQSILPTVASRAARVRLGPVSRPEIAALLEDRGVADAARSTSIARAARGRPGLGMTLAALPEASIVADRLARTLLDLARADPSVRLGAVGGLVADGAALDAMLRGEGSRAAGVTSARGARVAPAERRRAAARVLAAWRDLGRDLFVAASGGGHELNDPQLLEELRDVASRVEMRDLLAFLERLDALIAAVEGYANPELVLDALALAWPRARAA
ncbi:MAG: hypothetical protein H0V04_03205 [Chloroflexi bacterium]|nr:hypothetical protein [Chloroflexota bacterium]